MMELAMNNIEVKPVRKIATFELKRSNEKFEYSVDLHVGKRIKHRRIVLGITRKELADAVNVSVQQIHKYETGINRVSASKLYNIAVVLKVPVNYFYEMLEDCGLTSSSSLAEELEFNKLHGISEREVESLVKSYNKIKMSSARKKVNEVVSLLSETLTNNL